MNRIVLVEDDPDDVYLFRSSLQSVKDEFECQLTVLNDGQELLDFFADGKSEIKEELLILLDLNLPKMNGLDVLKKLKEENEVSKKVIIVFSTSKFQQDIDDAYELGAKSYIKKTTDLGGLRDIVKSLNKYWFEKAEFPKDKKK